MLYSSEVDGVVTVLVNLSWRRGPARASTAAFVTRRARTARAAAYDMLEGGVSDDVTWALARAGRGAAGQAPAHPACVRGDAGSCEGTARTQIRPGYGTRVPSPFPSKTETRSKIKNRNDISFRGKNPSPGVGGRERAGGDGGP